MHFASDVVAVDGGIGPCAAVLSVTKSHSLVGVDTELSSRLGVKAPPDAVGHAVVGTDDGFAHIVQLIGCAHFAVGGDGGEELAVGGQLACKLVGVAFVKIVFEEVIPRFGSVAVEGVATAYSDVLEVWVFLYELCYGQEVEHGYSLVLGLFPYKVGLVEW